MNTIDPHAIAAEMIRAGRDDIDRMAIREHLEEAGVDPAAILAEDVMEAVQSATMLVGWPDVPSLLVRADRYRRLVATEAEVDRLREQLHAAQPVIAAAQAWAEVRDDTTLTADDDRARVNALYDAVQQRRLMELALAAADREHTGEQTTTAQASR